jgi:hypothetical protein
MYEDEIKSNNMDLDYIIANPERAYEVSFTHTLSKDLYINALNFEVQISQRGTYTRTPSLSITALPAVKRPLSNQKCNYILYGFSEDIINYNGGIINYPGPEKYNKLLSIVEDITGIPIEEYTKYAFTYHPE